MLSFLNVGPHWFNLDRVARVELIVDARDAGGHVAARIHYTSGWAEDIRAAGDIQALAEWLQRNKAE